MNEKPRRPFEEFKQRMDAASLTAPQIPTLNQALEQIGTLVAKLASVEQENKLLREKLSRLIETYFGGRKSETIDPRQLDLLMAGLVSATVPGPPAAALTKPVNQVATPKKAVRQPLPEHLPEERIVLEPEEVKEQPQLWKQIDEEITQELDWQPGKFFKRLYIRPKYVRVQPVPVGPAAQVVGQALEAIYGAKESEVRIAPLPSRLIEKGLPEAGLLAQVVISKYEDHLPLYRQEKIYRERHGVKLARQSLADWVEQVAFWLKPIYQAIKKSLLAGGYLQGDETPIRYLDPDVPGKSQQGYLWSITRPGAEVLFDWQTSRGRAGPEELLKEFKGLLQTDGYIVYQSLAQEHDDWVLLVHCIINS